MCKRKIAAGLLAAVMLCGVLAGCGKRDDGAGKVINYPMEVPPQTLDTAIAQSAAELLVINNCMEGLVRQNADGSLEPGAALRWETAQDGKTMTFYLRGDNHWKLPEDAEALLGTQAYQAFDTQVTAADFVFGLQRALSPAVKAPGASLLFAIENASAVSTGAKPVSALGVRADGRSKLIITLERAAAAQEDTTLLYTLSQSVAMPCSQAYFEATAGRYGLEPKYLPCNGPFYLERMDDVLTRLRRSESYRSGGQGNALPATVNLWTDPDETICARLLGTEYDAAIVSAQAAALAPEGTKNIELNNAMLTLVFQCRRLDNVNLRLAMCTALEPQALGYSQGAAGLLPGGTRAGDENYRSLAGNAAGAAYDSARANALSGKAGQEKVSLQLICAPAHETLMRKVLQAWQKVFRLTLDTTIELLEPEELQQRLEAGTFDAAITTVQIENSFALRALQSMYGSGSLPRYQSAALDALLQSAAQTADPAQSAKACLQAEEHLLQNGVYYPLEQKSSSLLLASGIEGLSVSPAGDQIFFAHTVKFD